MAGQATCLLKGEARARANHTGSRRLVQRLALHRFRISFCSTRRRIRNEPAMENAHPCFDAETEDESAALFLSQPGPSSPPPPPLNTAAGRGPRPAKRQTRPLNTAAGRGPRPAKRQTPRRRVKEPGSQQAGRTCNICGRRSLIRYDRHLKAVHGLRAGTEAYRQALRSEPPSTSPRPTSSETPAPGPEPGRRQRPVNDGAQTEPDAPDSTSEEFSSDPEVEVSEVWPFDTFISLLHGPSHVFNLI